MDYGPEWPPEPGRPRRRMSRGRVFWLWARAAILVGLVLLLVCPPLLRALQVRRLEFPRTPRTAYATTTAGPPYRPR